MTAHKPAHALLLAGLLVAASLVAEVVSGDAYKPIFSADFLQQADPETRARLTALNEENRRKWLAAKAGAEIPPKPAAERRAPQAKAGEGSLYRYRDAKGKVRYSDTWVQGASVVRIDTQKPTAQSRKAYQDAQREQAKMLEYFDVKNAQKSQQRQAKAEAAEARRANAAHCRGLWLDLKDDKVGGFAVYELDENGERYFLNDAEIEANIARREAQYIKRCGPLPVEAD